MTEAEDEQEALLSFLYMCPVGIARIANDGSVRMMNPMAANLMMPIAPAGNLDNLFDALQPCAPDLRNIVASYTQPRGKICDNHRLYIGEVTGRPGVLACTIIRVDPSRMIVMLADISEQVLQERRLKEADAWLSAIFSRVNDFACFSLDANGLINHWSPSGRTQTGYAETEVLGHSLAVFRPGEAHIHTRVQDELDRARREGFYLHEGECAAKNGQKVWWQILSTAVKEDDGAISGFVVVLRDFTERKMTSDELRRLLTTDHLTGAANRAHFYELAATEIGRWQRHAQPLSVIMMDADHFKLVNDRFGHDAGDFVLRALVARTKPILRATDVLARFGGEEFVIMCPATDSAGALDLAERIRQVIAAAPVIFGDAAINVRVSLGCATMGNDFDKLGPLLKAADVALYRAKRLGRNQSCLFESQENVSDAPGGPAAA